MAMIIQLNSLSPLQKKIIAGALTLGAGFWGGIKFCDVKIKAQIGGYQIQIDKLNKNISDRDVTIDQHIKDKEAKITEAQIAKKQADEAHAQAAIAEQRYRQLVAEIPSGSTTTVQELAVKTEPTPIQIADACDQVIKAKDVEIVGLNTSLTACFNSKAAADQAIAELQANERDAQTKSNLQTQTNSGLMKQLESQKRRKWLYFAGGVVVTVLANKSLQKR